MHIPGLRTIWRRTILTIRITLVVALAALLLLKVIGRYRLAKAKTAFAKVYGSADPTAWTTHYNSDQDNAAQFLRAGVAALQIRSGELMKLSITASRSPEEWTEGERRELAGLIERNRLALALFHKAADISLSVYGSRCTSDVTSFPSPWIRQASQLLAGEAQLSYERGDRAPAVHSLRAITRLASSLEGEGPVINYLIGVAVETDGWQPALHWSQEDAKGDSETAFLASVDAAIPSLDLIAQFRRARGYEAVCFAIDSVTANSQRGAGLLLLWPIVELTEAEFLQGATRGARLINTDVPLLERMAALEPEAQKWALWPWAWDAAETDANLNIGVSRAVETLAVRQLLHAALQVRILGLKNGAYPAARPDLDALRKPEPISGQPLVYSVQADGTAVVTCVDSTLKLMRGGRVEPKRITLPRIGRKP